MQPIRTAFALLAALLLAAAAPVPTASLDAWLDAAAKYDTFSGTVLVARDGAPVFTASRGMANYELAVPATGATRYNLASLTKQFTAMAILQLQEQGKLRLTDSVCTYISRCPAAWQKVTLHQLLTHTGGIPNVSSLPDWDETLARHDYTPRQLVGLVETMPLDFPPGTKSHYSNTGYDLLGLVIERASGLSWGDYIEQRIFKPAGMTDSHIIAGRGLIPGRATGYYSLGTDFINAAPESPTTLYASGGLVSTAADLLRWDAMLAPGKLVSQASIDAMFTPEKDGYGYGWRIGEKFGRRETDHSGAGNGFSTYIIRFPADRLTVIVLGNSDRMSAAKVGNALAGITLGEPVKLPTPQLADLLWTKTVTAGAPAALALYDQTRAADPKAITDETLVDLGYELFEARRYPEARAMFTRNLALYPKSAYSLDGLADIALAEGNPAAAARYFEQSLKLDPKNDYAERGLAKARADLTR